MRSSRPSTQFRYKCALKLISELAAGMITNLSGDHLAQYKFILKWFFAPHILILIFMWAKVGSEVLRREFGWRSAFFERLDMPSAYPWEYVWCLSFIPIICAMLSFPKNRVKLINYHYYGHFLFGILPCMIGLGGQLPELFDYMSDQENSQTPTFKGVFPMVIIWYIFFAVALQIHGFAMYFSYHLAAAWTPVKRD
ncbi:hypothetical protein ANCDUO_15701 [Ancylostoma duodenale]|uniref:Uncharacterized protein n=1 Tax=Ancylostoma duodenale TaxID=51022 RepID=A0A0C2FZU7_9BILA|nr:hypothetical protein ANCDUO_15701 [Ancylostoma duodenale]